MPLKETYQVRNGRGHIRTIIAFSHKGAIEAFIGEYPTESGETLEVKRRGYGSDDWQAFRLS